MRTSALVWSWILASSFAAATAAAAPVVETNDRLEVNWSNLHIRFFGEATVGSDPAGDGFRAAEKRAWQNGLIYANQAVRDLNVSTNEAVSPNAEKLGEDAKQAAKQVATSTFSLYTTYFGDGTVRVQLESLLPKALETSAIHFRQKEGTEPASEFTGLVVTSDKPLKPAAMYQIADETGALLFDVKDMAQDAYKKNLMGRWFKRPTAAELADAVGKSPVSVHATVKDGRFLVNREEWDKALEGHKSLLVNGRVALALP